MQASPAEAPASAFNGDSVMNSSTFGLPNSARHRGGTSISMWPPAGASYLMGFPCLFDRGSSRHRRWVSTVPLTLKSGTTMPTPRCPGLNPRADRLGGFCSV
jgi:hypothetical protein